MRILIAEDEAVSRLKLEAMLTKRGFEVVAAADGHQAWQLLQVEDPPRLAILDWMMPGIDGVELCRKARLSASLRGLYLILLTGKGNKEDIIEGLQAGANDYVTKPFDPAEMQARIQVAAQVVQLQSELAARVQELEDALAHVKQLQVLLPICSYCKNVRDDQNYWHQVDQYLMRYSAAKFSHGICPRCMEEIVKPELRRNGIAMCGDWPG
jgi:DNA-binding response OmpR family regulator